MPDRRTSQASVIEPEKPKTSIGLPVYRGIAMREMGMASVNGRDYKIMVSYRERKIGTPNEWQWQVTQYGSAKWITGQAPTQEQAHRDVLDVLHKIAEGYGPPVKQHGKVKRRA